MEKKVKETEKNALVVANEKKNMEQEATAIQKEIEQRTAELQKCLAELERKKKLSENRVQFMDVMDRLEQAEDILLQENEFNTDVYKLRFCNAANYREDDVFTISNREIIIDFVRYIREKVIAKVREIESQLMA